MRSSSPRAVEPRGRKKSLGSWLWVIARGFLADLSFALRVFFGVLAFFALCYLGLLSFFFWRQDEIFFGTAEKPSGSPEQEGRPSQEVFTAFSQTRMWIYEGEAEGALVYLCGRSEHLGRMAERIGGLLAIVPRTCVFVEMPGGGFGAGTPEVSVYLRAAEESLEYLEAERGIARSNCILWGRDLGACLVVQLVGSGDVEAIVLEDPFVSLERLAGRHFPMLPLGLVQRRHYNMEPELKGLRAPALVL
ncbi:MAG: hypothetical protein HQL31_09915, partial [Planctomycetes bacterium]|nr:hypothetical protein [Planctomycetota bacterium]